MTLRDIEPARAGATFSAPESTPRIQRPVPARAAPLRGAVHAFRSAAAPSDTAATHGVSAVSGPARSVIDSAVETAYQVYEEYVTTGQRAAARQETLRARGMPMEHYHRYQEPNPLGTWVHLWMDMYRQWTGSVLMLMMSGVNQALEPFADGAQRPAHPHEGPYRTYGSPTVPPAHYQPEPASYVPVSAPSPSPSPTPSPSASTLGIEVRTSRRCRVDIHLLRPAAHESLSAVLFNEDGLRQLRFNLDPANLRFDIDESHTAGVYSGIVRDADGQQAGMLTIQVYPES